MSAAAAILPEKRQSAGELVGRSMVLRRAQEILGQQALADAPGVSPRTLRAYLGFEIPLRDETLVLAAAAIDKHAAGIVAVAAKLREAAGQ